MQEGKRKKRQNRKRQKASYNIKKLIKKGGGNNMGINTVDEAKMKVRDRLRKYLSSVEGEEQLEVIEDTREFLTEWKAGLASQGIKLKKKADEEKAE